MLTNVKIILTLYNVHAHTHARIGKEEQTTKRILLTDVKFCEVAISRLFKGMIPAKGVRLLKRFKTIRC